MNVVNNGCISMTDYWRVLELSTYNAAMNMAIDEAIANSIALGTSPPTIRFYTWSPSAVSIGYFQSMRDEVDVDYCMQHNIDIVRRRTGGGAVYHDTRGELTYSIIAPQHMFSRDIIHSYREICGCIVDGLRELGMNAEFKPINDIAVNGRKVSGNAQSRRNGVLQQHGTILYDLDVETMFRCLKVSDEKIRDKMISSVKERVTSVKQQSNARFDELYKAIQESFCKGKRWGYGELTEDEVMSARELSKGKYSSSSWNFSR